MVLKDQVSKVLLKIQGWALVYALPTLPFKRQRMAGSILILESQARASHAAQWTQHWDLQDSPAPQICWGQEFLGNFQGETGKGGGDGPDGPKLP